MPSLEFTDTGGQNPQQLVFALAVFWQMTCWVVSPWNVYSGYPLGPTATDSVVSTGFTLNAFVGVFVTCTPVPMLTFLLPVDALAYPLLAGCVGAFEGCPVVLSSCPQAAAANEVNATRRMP